jgi:hypothetical membrane protein
MNLIEKVMVNRSQHLKVVLAVTMLVLVLWASGSPVRSLWPTPVIAFVLWIAIQLGLGYHDRHRAAEKDGLALRRRATCGRVFRSLARQPLKLFPEMPGHAAERGEATPEAEVGAAGHMLAWGAVGAIAQVAFVAGWLIADTWQRPGYSSIKNSISDLQAATAPHAWFPIACFAVGGLGTFGFAVFGLRPALARAGKIAAYGPWMLAVAGLAIGNSFPLIPCQRMAAGCTAHVQLHSPGGMTDAIVATIAFLVLAATPFPLWRRLKALPEWRRLKPVMTAARVIGPVCLVLLVLFSDSGPAGLAERILAATLSLWISALAITLICNTRHALRSPASIPGRSTTQQAGQGTTADAGSSKLTRIGWSPGNQR